MKHYHIPVYYSFDQSVNESIRTFHNFNNKRYNSIKQLMTAFVEDEASWEEAKVHLSRGYLTKWFESNKDYDNVRKIDKIKEEAHNDLDLALFRIIYTFHKDLPFTFYSKLISPKNLYASVGKVLRKENTKGEEIIVRW